MEKSKWAILFTVLVMMFMVMLDSSIVNVAILPVMQKELAAGLDQIQWASLLYLLTTCALLLVFGRLGEYLRQGAGVPGGRGGVLLGSLSCGTAVTPPAVVAARAAAGGRRRGRHGQQHGDHHRVVPRPRTRARPGGILASFVALGMMRCAGGFIVSVLPGSSTSSSTCPSASCRSSSADAAPRLFRAGLEPAMSGPLSIGAGHHADVLRAHIPAGGRSARPGRDARGRRRAAGALRARRALCAGSCGARGPLQRCSGQTLRACSSPSSRSASTS